MEIVRRGLDVALLASFQKFYGGRIPEVKRWIDPGEIVEFTDPVFTSRNAEFAINHNEKQKIWFSQLDDIFINPFPKSLNDLTVITWVFKDLHQDVDGFWGIVKGKKFRVSVKQDFSYVINWEHQICYQFVNYRDALMYYLENYKQKNYDAIMGMLKHSFCYTFEEIK